MNSLKVRITRMADDCEVRASQVLGTHRRSPFYSRIYRVLEDRFAALWDAVDTGLEDQGEETEWFR